MTIPFLEIQRLLELLVQFQQRANLTSCLCERGTLVSHYLGTAVGEANNFRGSYFVANRQWLHGFVLNMPVTDLHIAQGQELPNLDGTDAYYRFSRLSTYQSRYSLGIWDPYFGFCGGPEGIIQMSRTWVRAGCAEDSIVVYPALGHTIHVYATFLYPPTDGCGDLGNPSTLQGGAGGDPGDPGDEGGDEGGDPYGDGGSDGFI